MSKQSNKNKNTTTLIYIIIVGFLLRLISLNQSLWLDEATSALVARDYSPGYILTNFLPKDFHPPLYYFTLKLWSLAFGTSEISLRFPSIIFALLTIFLVYQIGKIIDKASSGKLAALLLATSPLHIYYSQEARMYSMSTLFVALSVLLFLNLISKKPKKWHGLAFAGSLLLIFFTDYLPILILPVFWVWALTNKQNKRWWVNFIASHIVLAIGFLAYWPIFSSQLFSGLAVKSNISSWWQVLGKTTPKAVALIPTKFLLGRISFQNKFIYALVVTISSLVMAVPLSKTGNKKYRLIWLWFILPIILAIILGNFISILSYFRLIFTLPALYILIAVGLSKINEKSFLPLLSFILAINFIFTGLYLRNTKFHREDWRSFVQYIDKNSVENSQIIFPSSSQMEALFYYQPSITFTDINGLKETTNQIYLVRYVVDIVDKEDHTRKKIESLGYNKIEEKDFNGVIVWKYQNGKNSN